MTSSTDATHKSHTYAKVVEQQCEQYQGIISHESTTVTKVAEQKMAGIKGPNP